MWKIFETATFDVKNSVFLKTKNTRWDMATKIFSYISYVTSAFKHFKLITFNVFLHQRILCQKNIWRGRTKLHIVLKTFAKYMP